MEGSELKKSRNSLGLTQEEFAKELKVATNTVARWERNERAIPPYLSMALETLERKLRGDNESKTECGSD